MAMLEVKDLQVYYGVIQALKGISFHVNQGEVIALIGANGAGKTTTLQTLTGILSPKSGSIVFEGKDLTRTPAHKIVEMGMAHVPEGRRVFADMSVYENLLLGAYTRKDKAEIAESLAGVYKRFPRLEERKGQRAGTLSGGEQQMLAMGRALMSRPRIILMDEPFSALDPITRTQIQTALIDMQTAMKRTIVFVTHDMDEAIKLADRICIMEEGKITQFDTPENILKNPANDFVRNFIGPKRIWTSPEYIKTRDIMITDPVCCHPKMPIFKCIETMGRKKVDTLMLTDQKGRLFGVLFAESLIGVHDIKKPAEDFMYREFTSVGPDSSIVDLLTLFDEHHLSTLPVVNSQGIIEGLITRSTLINTLSRQFIADAGKEES